MSNFVSIKAGAGMEELTIETKPGDGPVIGTGAHIWPGGRAAAVYLAGHARNVLANRVVLEVGSGTGLLGLVAAQLGAARVVLSDVTEMLPLLEANVARNRAVTTAEVDVVALHWGEDDVHEDLPPLDWILASDCVYSMEAIEPLLDALVAHAVPGKTTVLMATEIRDSDVCTTFLQRAAERGFKARKVASKKHGFPDMELHRMTLSNAT